jgi:carboxypeptidase Q
MSFLRVLIAGALVLLALTSRAAQAQLRAAPPPPLTDAATYAAIRDKALASSWAYERLSDLTDLIGPRLSGSPQAQAAVEQIAAVMRGEGLKVTLEPMQAPHWVRGEERAELIEYAQRPKGITQSLQLSTLGGSVATPAQGISAEVLVVKSFADLSARAKQAKGRIVLFDVPFDQSLAENGLAGSAYGQVVAYRVGGASAAAKAGAVAALVRGAGGADYRLLHTGVMAYEEGVPKIPTAALTAEDVGLVVRLAKRGPVTMRLVLTPEQQPDVPSFNVVGELTGAQKPNEVVIVSGHLDSWDLGTGAVDDGTGVVAAIGAVRVLRELKLRPKRSVRVIAYMSEEAGAIGGRAYFEAHRGELANMRAVIETDFGAGSPLGFEAYALPEAMPKLRALQDVLAPIGATYFRRSERPVGADIAAWEAAGVPGFETLLDSRHYFDLHHTPADTLDKVDPKNLARIVSAVAVLTYHLAETPDPPTHLPALPQP